MSIRNKVLAAYKRISPATPRQVADYTKLEYKQVSGAVTQLAEQGKLERVSRGVYTYVWHENEKRLADRLIGNTKLEETTVVISNESTDAAVVIDQESNETQAFTEFLIDHGIEQDIIDQIVLLADYYTRYVAK